MASYIEGVVKSIIYQNLDSVYKVIKINTTDGDDMIVVGTFPIIEIEAKYRFYGEMILNEKYGLELKSSSYETINHDTKSGVIAYLSSGNFKGIGEKTATKIVEKLGTKAITMIKDDPNCLKGIGLNEKKCIELSETLKKLKDVENIYIKLYQYGLSPNMAKKVYSIYEDESIKKIEENPYILIKDVNGFGFYKCDQLAINMGFSLDDKRRITEGILYTLNEACIQKGFTYLTYNQLLNTSKDILTKNNSISIDEKRIEECILDLIESKRLIVDNYRYYPKYLYDCEKNCRNRLFSIKDKKIKLPKLEESLEKLEVVERNLGFKLTDEQKKAVINSITSKISIITGGPGTGKTTIVKAILMLEAFINKKEITDDDFQNNTLLISPTGKASKRLGISCNIKAMTIHKALGYNQEGKFTYDKMNPLNYKFIIIDESSMIDIILLDKLLDALKDDCKIIFVGDVNQLPSVGPGNVLYEMINSNQFMTTTLNTIMRQEGDSNIIKLSSMVLDKNINFDIFKEHKEVYFYDADSQVVLDNIRKLLNLFISRGGSLLKDIQILVPMYSGVCGIDNINKMISSEFNPSTKMIIRNDKCFKENDKVIMLQNNALTGIMNGDEGIIKSISHEDEKDYVYVDFNDKMIKLESQDLDNISLAYAISIHKSQGSEYENVIIPIVSSFKVMLKPKLIYTAITRAKKKLIILGKRDVILKSLYEPDDVRQTSLFNNISNVKNVIYINNDEIPFDTLGEENMENISPYDFM